MAIIKGKTMETTRGSHRIISLFLSFSFSLSLFLSFSRSLSCAFVWFFVCFNCTKLLIIANACELFIYFVCIYVVSWEIVEANDFWRSIQYINGLWLKTFASITNSSFHFFSCETTTIENGWATNRNE